MTVGTVDTATFVRDMVIVREKPIHPDGGLDVAFHRLSSIRIIVQLYFMKQYRRGTIDISSVRYELDVVHIVVRL